MLEISCSATHCVYSDQQCDVIIHCKFGDDEEYCNVDVCPLGCNCHAGAMICEIDKSLSEHLLESSYKITLYSFPTIQ